MSLFQASGISITTEWASERPPWTRNCRALSMVALSLAVSDTNGKILGRSSPKRSEESVLERARIQLRLPQSVLISPLWAR